MKPRTTLLLALIGGGLFAYIWFVERHQDSTRESEEASAKVVRLEREKIEHLSLRNGATLVELRKKDGVWMMEKPVADQADAGAVERILGLVEGLRHDAKIELTKGKEAEMLKEFGVDESQLSLKLKGDSGKDLELLVGKDSAVAGKLYVRQQGQNTVFVIRKELRTQMTAQPDDFRDHNLSGTQARAVQRFSLKTAEGEVELERKNNHWDILKPLRARAADSKINDLLAELLTAQVSQFLPPTPAPEQGLGEPRATFTLSVEGQKEPITLKVGAAPAGENNKEKSYVKLSSRPAVTVVPNKALDPFLKARPNDLRDRKLVRVEADIVDRITIEPDGGPALTLARKGDAWIQKDGDKENAVKDGLAAKLLADIQSAEAVNLVADLAPDLAPYGLAKPLCTVRLSSYASENTAESKAGEKAITTILFGTVEGDAGYAKLEEEPFIVAVPKSLLEGLPRDSYDLLPPASWESLLTLNPADVEAIEISSKNGGPSVRLEKKDGTWKAAVEGAKANEGAVQNFLTLLAGLQGGHRTGSHAPLDKALSSPSLQLTLGLRKEGKPSKIEIRVGEALKDGSFPVRISEKEGVYLLQSTDRGALEHKLLE